MKKAPRRRGLRIVRDGVFFFEKTPSLNHSVAPPFQTKAQRSGFGLVGVLFLVSWKDENRERVIGCGGGRRAIRESPLQNRE